MAGAKLDSSPDRPPAHAMAAQTSGSELLQRPQVGTSHDRSFQRLNLAFVDVLAQLGTRRKTRPGGDRKRKGMGAARPRAGGDPVDIEMTLIATTDAS